MSLPKSSSTFLGRVTTVTDKSIKNPVRETNVIITISSQIKPKTDQELNAVAGCLEHSVADMLTPEGLAEIITIKEKEYNEGHRFTSEYIMDINSEYSIEIGERPRGSRVHTHIIVNVSHKTKIWFDYQSIKDFMDEAMTSHGCPKFKGVYASIKLIKGMINARDYLRKQIREKKGKIISETTPITPTSTILGAARTLGNPTVNEHGEETFEDEMQELAALLSSNKIY